MNIFYVILDKLITELKQQEEFPYDLGISFPNENFHFKNYLKSLNLNNNYNQYTSYYPRSGHIYQTNGFVAMYP